MLKWCAQCAGKPVQICTCITQMARGVTLGYMFISPEPQCSTGADLIVATGRECCYLLGNALSTAAVLCLTAVCV